MAFCQCASVLVHRFYTLAIVRFSEFHWQQEVLRTTRLDCILLENPNPPTAHIAHMQLQVC